MLAIFLVLLGYDDYFQLQLCSVLSGMHFKLVVYVVEGFLRMAPIKTIHYGQLCCLVLLGYSSLGHIVISNHCLHPHSCVSGFTKQAVSQLQRIRGPYDLKSFWEEAYVLPLTDADVKAVLSPPLFSTDSSTSSRLES